MKRFSSLIIAVVLGASVFMFSCGGGGQQPAAEEQTQEQAVTPATTAPDATATMMARGEAIYKEKCIVCHQATGAGVEGAFPSLIGSDFLLNQTKLAVSQVLNGSEKVAANRSIKYPAPMPPQLDTKEDAVAVVNYVLKNFGNDGKLITLEEVADIEILPRN